MTTFVLVSGVFTGPHVWEDTASRLSAAGAEVRAVALSGLGGGRPSGAEDIDLETHIADVLGVVDSVAGQDGREIVLVGHDYGIHPVLAAADRRAESIARVVYLDSGLPQDGVPALARWPTRACARRCGDWPRTGRTGRCRLPHGTRGICGAAQPGSPTRRSTGSPPSPRRSRWARCSSRWI